MKKLIVTGLIGTIVTIALSCGDANTSSGTPAPSGPAQPANGNPSYDPHRGEGKFTKVDVGSTVDQSMADNGNKIYGVKCQGCHKLTEEKLVGPGWKGVTTRHSAEWIMNFITNTDEMITKDPKAQAMLELCLVRMPNQNLSDDDARALYEFQRKNDGAK